ncbi:J domain-containing protein [Vibrio splendidus]|uniref:J domain-containing protein n=1 Tax=Vibrio splendidus TaxID=29497 RepID=UPI00148E4F62|nr:J domain-containing protein [Vibrio splendidus]NOI89375.1 J domain-containing protein [Vibrio splendidus]
MEQSPPTRNGIPFKMITFHEILGTTNTSTTQEIKKRYKLLSVKCHPDKGGSNELFKIIKLAFDKAIEGNGSHVFSQNNANDANIEKQLRTQISQLENVISREQSAKESLSVELKKSKLKSEKLEIELQQQGYYLSALEKQKNAAPINSSNKTLTFATIIMAILSFIAGFTVSERLHQNTLTYSIIEPNPLSRAKAEKQQIYKLHLMTLRSDHNAKSVALDLKKRGYNAFIEPSLNYNKVIVSMTVSHKKEIDATIDALKKLTGAQAIILNSGISPH